MHELPPVVAITIGGMLGALTNAVLGSKVIVLPQVRGHRVHLGFLAQLIVCVGVAHAVDHDFQTAYFSSLCGMALLRSVKRRVDRVFVEGRMGDDEGVE